MNTFKSTLLLVVMTLLLMFVGAHFGGQNGMVIALVVAVAMNFTSYFFSDKIALAMYSAQPVTREQLPRAYAVVERLTARQGLPMPKMYVLPTESPNAFATGRNPQHASVALTHGILQLLDDEELEGVLAHELGHVKNRDILNQFDCSHAGRCDYSSGAHGLLGLTLWRGWRTRRTGAGQRRHRWAADACAGADCGNPDPVGGLALAGV